MHDDEMRSIEIAGCDILIVRKDGEFFAIGNVCSHSWGLLDQGTLIGYEVKCPLHRGRFDIRTGNATERPATTPVPSYKTKIDPTGTVNIQLKAKQPMSPDDAQEQGGDPACWLSLICEECGAVVEADGCHRPGCAAGDRSHTPPTSLDSESNRH